MAFPSKAPELNEAVAELKRDPSRPVRAHVDGLEVELRVVDGNDATPGLGTRLAAIGPWEGVSMNELLDLLREGRQDGGTAEPLELP